MMEHRPLYNMKTIGQNLRQLRLAKNLTVEEVREYLYLGSVQAVYKYEKGLCYPQADTMLALMELYDADLQDIIKNCEEEHCSSSCTFYSLGDSNDAFYQLKQISSNIQNFLWQCSILSNKY